MPTYDYRCSTCSTQFELFQSFSEDTLTKCPIEGGPAECTAPGEGDVKKVFSAVGIAFKGSGFYKNDARGSSSGGADPGPAQSPSSSSSDSGSSSSSDGGSSTSDSTSSSKKDSGSSQSDAKSSSTSTASKPSKSAD